MGTAIEVRGLLGAIEWDQSDSVTTLALFTADEETYLIDVTPENRGLLNLLRKMVIIRGALTWSSRGAKKLEITSFHLASSIHED